MSSKFKLGLFFGSFDPIHNGHQVIAKKALEFVDVVMFIVAKQNPFKDKSKACFSDRYEMCRQACFWEDKMMPVDFEQNLSGKTWDTLEYIKKVYTNAELYIICGDDTYFDIENWYHGEEILENYKFLVFKRDYQKCITLRDNAQILNVIGFDKFSSTLVRQLIKEKSELVQYYIQPRVYKYIKENNLYVDTNKT